MSFREARTFVARHHHHHLPPAGHMFSVAVTNGDDEIVGVAMVGRPVARLLWDGWTLEVSRTATDGTRNANSALYPRLGARLAHWALCAAPRPHIGRGRTRHAHRRCPVELVEALPGGHRCLLDDRLDGGWARVVMRQGGTRQGRVEVLWSNRPVGNPPLFDVDAA